VNLKRKEETKDIVSTAKEGYAMATKDHARAKRQQLIKTLSALDKK